MTVLWMPKFKNTHRGAMTKLKDRRRWEWVQYTRCCLSIHNNKRKGFKQWWSQKLNQTNTSKMVWWFVIHILIIIIYIYCKRRSWLKSSILVCMNERKCKKYWKKILNKVAFSLFLYFRLSRRSWHADWCHSGWPAECIKYIRQWISRR